MPSRIFNLLVFGASLLAAVLLVPFLRLWWFDLLLQDRVFSSGFIWWDGPYLLIWLFEFLWSFGVGYMLARMLRRAHVVLWAVCFGLLFELLHFALSSHGFGQEPHWSIYVWTYGQYFVPCAGAASGAFVATKLWPRHQQGLQNAA